jgi:D-alanyl-D-alanine carboxypeptidase
MNKRRTFIQGGVALLGTAGFPRWARAQERLVRDPYVGAIVTAPLEGRVLFEDRAEVSARPASLTKLMTLYAVLEAVR